MLYIFDFDGTLIRSFMREEAGKHGTELKADVYDVVEVLPGRAEALRRLLTVEGHALAAATNQGGVAFGYQTVGQVALKMERVVEALGLQPYEMPVYVCHHHPKATADPDHWRDPAGCQRRKPAPGMLLEAMNDLGFSTRQTVYVGDMDTDKLAAGAAGIAYVDAEEFFAEGYLDRDIADGLARRGIKGQ